MCRVATGQTCDQYRQVALAEVWVMAAQRSRPPEGGALELY